MTFLQIKGHIMTQTNNDSDDLADALPHIEDYINEGYDLLMGAWADTHIGEGYDAPRLTRDDDAPMLPEWTHRAIADWATWLMYRNGNPQKQQRGMQYRVAFLEVVSRVRRDGGKKGRRDTLVNVYAPKFYGDTGRAEDGGFSPFE